MADKSIGEVIKENSARLMGLPGVFGVGEGVSGKNQCLVVFVADDADIASMPDKIEGYPVVIERSETFRARGT